MNLAEYISDRTRRANLASAVNSIPDYLWQIATNRRRASTDLAQRIEKETCGAVSKESLRPDVWPSEKAA